MFMWVSCAASLAGGADPVILIQSNGRLRGLGSEEKLSNAAGAIFREASSSFAG
jgi:hypothetical protein